MKPLALALCALPLISCWRGEEPFTSVGGGSSLHGSGWGNLSAKVYSSSRNRLNYAVVTAAQEFEPLCPPTVCAYRYTRDRGGMLTINGQPVLPGPVPRVLALNPFGEMEEFIVTQAEASIVLGGDPKVIWEKVVLPHLALVDGRIEDGKRLGHWTVSGKSGVKGYEGDYVDGRRDGLWKYYAADGKLRATLSYKLGRLDGDATEIDADGRVARRVRWKDDRPLDGPQTWRSMSVTTSRSPEGGGTTSGH